MIWWKQHCTCSSVLVMMPNYDMMCKSEISRGSTCVSCLPRTPMRACAHTDRNLCARAHAFPAEDQSAERSRYLSVKTAKRLSVDASPALKQPITLSIAGRPQLSSQSAVKMLLQRSACGTSPWHGFIVTGGALTSVLIAFGTKLCVCGSDFCGPRSEGIVYEL